MVAFGEHVQIFRQCGNGNGETQSLPEITECLCDQRSADNDQRSARQNGFDENLDCSTGRTVVIEVHRPGWTKIGDRAVVRANPDEPGLAVAQRAGRGFFHRTQRATAADPANDLAIASNDRLRPFARRGAPLNMNDCCHRKGLPIALHARHAIDDVLRLLGH